MVSPFTACGRYKTYTGPKTSKTGHLSLPAAGTRHILVQKTTKTGKQEPTHNNAATDDHIMEPEATIKTCANANTNKLEHT